MQSPAPPGPPVPTHQHAFRYLRNMTVSGRAYDVFFCQVCLEYRVVEQDRALELVRRAGPNGSWGG